MDHLDLAEVLSTPWLPPYGQNGDSSYVIRSALEPIIEETSDDDENAIADQWTEMEHTTWSSESETGSVIRVEIHQGTSDGLTIETSQLTLSNIMVLQPLV